ncbi:MAG: cytochrome c3 family protein [Myxococcales bacterium]|nr:cytochrome c3 family protein [Myxococcales bacterium]
MSAPQRVGGKGAPGWRSNAVARRRAALVLALAALVTVVTVATFTTVASARGAAPSPLYPSQDPGQAQALRFSHAQHGARGIECLRCHVTARTSLSAVDSLLPAEAACRQCHPVDRQAASAAACGKCHAGFAVGAPLLRVSARPPALKLSHAAHAQVPCERCHASAPGEAAAPSGAPGAPPSGRDAPGLPSMESCLSCHRDGRRVERCTACHLSSSAGRIDVTLGGFAGAPAQVALRPRSALWGDAHGPGFASDHRAAATRIDRTCAACHDESYCSDCHVGAVRPMEFHPDDYLQVHAREARRAASECSTCHRLQSFCVGCHERTGVGTRAASEWSSGQGAGAFHPAGWAASERGRAENRHAREATRNLPACASCHREDDCLRCHSADAGGLRVSPHPPAWRGSAQCRALDRANRRMCLRCHVVPEELGCDFTAQGR